MKKLLLIPLLLIALFCSSDEMDDSNSRTTDPFIGTWDMYLDGSIEERFTINKNGTYTTVNGNGGFWLNISSTENFNNYTQTYRLTADVDEVNYNELIIQFDDDWNGGTSQSDGDNLTFQRISD